MARKNCDISYTERDFETENFTGSEFEGTPKLVKAFFLETIFKTILRDFRGSNSDSFSSTDLKFDSFIAK